MVILVLASSVTSWAAGDSDWRLGLGVQLGYGEIGGARFSTQGNVTGGFSVSLLRRHQEWFVDAEAGTWSEFRHRGTTQLDYRVRVTTLRLGHRQSWRRLLGSVHGGFANYSEDATSNDVFGREEYRATHQGAMVGLGLGLRVTHSWDLRADHDWFLGGRGSSDASWPLATEDFTSLSVKLRWRIGLGP